MTKTDYALEKHYKSIGERPQRKFEETITTFNRDIYYYNLSEVTRQAATTSTKVTYEDHRKMVEIAVNMMKKDTIHDIAMCILTHRFFENYRNSVFAGKGNFTLDYSFLVSKASMIFNPSSSTINKVNIATKLSEFTKPTLVAINHIAGTVDTVTPPGNKFTLNEWGIKYNETANESTTYHLAGMSI